MAASTLTPFQTEVLDRFFQREQRLFLSGGAALAGFHLGHRPTHDLDLFAILDEAGATLALVAREIGASIEAVTTAPDFRRRLLKRGAEAVIVDLVRERVVQVAPTKLQIGAIRVDPAPEIFANKLCTLLSRTEIRDLVDTRALERSGLDLQEGLAAGHLKDGGLTPAQLAWVLSQITIGDDARPPGGVSVAELREYLASLIARLSRMSFPNA